jgi:membrane associated rhomboid family serine protease
MFFPIGDDQIRGGSLPVFSYGLLFANLIIFTYEVSLAPELLQQFVLEFGTIPSEIGRGEDLYTLITSMFLHGSWLHLIMNMLFLWVFADNIEAVIGNVPFLLFYLLGGVVASLAHVFLNPGSDVPGLGASGAISAVLGAYLVMFPSSRVRTLLFLVIIVRRINMPAFAFLGIWIVFQLFSGIQDLNMGSPESGGTAWWAHIGGFFFGFLAGAIFRVRLKRFV